MLLHLLFQMGVFAFLVLLQRTYFSGKIIRALRECCEQIRGCIAPTEDKVAPLKLTKRVLDLWSGVVRRV